MSGLEERLAALEDAPSSLDHMVECAALAADARVAGDSVVAVCAKAKEAYVARDLAQQQHCVVAGAELVELWPDVERLEPLPAAKARRVLHAFQCAAGAAMDLPEIPLATVEQLVGYTERALVHQGAAAFAGWLLRGRLAQIEGDAEEVRRWVERIAPTINRYNWVYNFTSCPGCEVAQIAGWMGRDTSPEELTAVLEPVLTGEARWKDPPSHVAWLEQAVGSGVCEGSRSIAPRLLARCLAAAGRHAEAGVQARKALDRSKDRNAEEHGRLLTMRLDVAAASKKGVTVERCVKELEPLVDRVEDAYELHDALVAACKAIASTTAAMKLASKYASMREQALGLARRLDARLKAPRHVAATEATLPATIAAHA